jgi:hypothetical protein
MKIRFLKTISVDVEPRHFDEEVYSRSFRKWDEIRVVNVFQFNNRATIETENKEFLLNVPLDAFEKLVEKRASVLL